MVAVDMELEVVGFGIYFRGSTSKIFPWIRHGRGAKERNHAWPASSFLS